MQLIEAGTRVSWAKAWLQSVQRHDLGRAEGTVEEVVGVLAYVRWDAQPNDVKPVIVRNLVATNRKHQELF